MAVDPQQALLGVLRAAGPPGMDTAGMPPVPAGPPAGEPPLSPLEATQSVLQDLHELISILPDPNHVRVASQCLTAIAGIQKDLMGGRQGAGSQTGGY